MKVFMFRHGRHRIFGITTVVPPDFPHFDENLILQELNLMRFPEHPLQILFSKSGFQSLGVFSFTSAVAHLHSLSHSEQRRFSSASSAQISLVPLYE
jgi:hypothetical protein